MIIVITSTLGTLVSFRSIRLARNGVESLISDFTMFTALSTARSVSSSIAFVEPLNTIVAILFSSSSRLNTVQNLLEISLNDTESARPSSSGFGVSSLTIGVAPSALAILFSSHLLMILRAKMPYFSEK